MAIIPGESPCATPTLRLAGETPFIILSGDQDIDAETRTFIRSYVMLGRKPNTERGSIISKSQPTPSSLIPNKVSPSFFFTQFADTTVTNKIFYGCQNI
jgi:hypothetical protein